MSSRVLWLCVLLVEAALIYLLATGLTFSLLGVGARAGRLGLVLHTAAGLFVLVPALFTAIVYLRLPRRASRGGVGFAATVIGAATTIAAVGSGIWLTSTYSPALSWLHLASGVAVAIALPALLWRVSQSPEPLLSPPIGLQSRHVYLAAAGAVIVACVLQPIAAWVAVGGDGLISAGSTHTPGESCGRGGCHPDALEEWSASAHALATPPGVTCLDCHTGAESGEPSSPAPVLFSDSATPGLRGAAGRLLIRADPDAHAASLRTPETGCTTCHEDATSPAAAGEVMADASDSSCIECHMPATSGAESSETDPSHRSHRFPGGLSATDRAGREGASHTLQRDLARQWMRSSHLLVDIYPPRDPRASRARSFVPNALFESSEALPYVTLGEQLELKVAVTNARSGHAFPFRVRGDARNERQSWLAVEVLDGQNRLIFESGALGPSGELSRSGTRVYHSDRTSPSPPRIRPGASEVNAFRFRVPYWAKGDLTVLARVRYRSRAACNRDPKSIDEPGCERDGWTPQALDLARASRSFPIRVRPERELPAEPASPPAAVPESARRVGT